jgi:hypothetical protein
MKTLVKWCIGSTWVLLLATSSFAQTTIEEHLSGLLLVPGRPLSQHRRSLILSRSGVRKQWRMLPVGKEFVVIQHRPSGLVLTAAATHVSEDGCPVFLSAHTGGKNQQWRIVPHGGMAIKPHTITNRASGFLLSAGTRASENGSPVLSKADCARYRYTYWHIRKDG